MLAGELAGQPLDQPVRLVDVGVQDPDDGGDIDLDEVKLLFWNRFRYRLTSGEAGVVDQDVRCQPQRRDTADGIDGVSYRRAGSQLAVHHEQPLWNRPAAIGKLIFSRVAVFFDKLAPLQKAQHSKRPMRVLIGRANR